MADLVRVGPERGPAALAGDDPLLGVLAVALAAPMLSSEGNHERSVPPEPLARQFRPRTATACPVRTLPHRRVSASISSISWADAIHRSCKRLTRPRRPLLSRELRSRETNPVDRLTVAGSPRLVE